MNLNICRKCSYHYNLKDDVISEYCNLRLDEFIKKNVYWSAWSAYDAAALCFHDNEKYKNHIFELPDKCPYILEHIV